MLPPVFSRAVADELLLKALARLVEERVGPIYDFLFFGRCCFHPDGQYSLR